MVGSAAISSRSAALTASRTVISAGPASVPAGAGSTCVDITPNLLDRGERRLLRLLCLVVDEPLRLVADRCLLIGGQGALRGELVAEHRDRVACLPAVELALRPVLRRIGARMAAVPVRLHLEQRRALARPAASDRLGHGLVDGVCVLAVDDDPRNPVRLRADREVLERSRLE